MTPRYWSIRPSTHGWTADVRGKELGFVEQIGGDIDEALVNEQHDDFDEQGHPGRRAGGQLIEQPKTFVAARPV